MINETFMFSRDGVNGAVRVANISIEVKEAEKNLNTAIWTSIDAGNLKVDPEIQKPLNAEQVRAAEESRNADLEKQKIETQNNITGLYREILGREPDKNGLEHWMNLVDGGMAIEAIKQAFQENEEGKIVASRRETERIAAEEAKRAEFEARQLLDSINNNVVQTFNTVIDEAKNEVETQVSTVVNASSSQAQDMAEPVLNSFRKAAEEKEEAEEEKSGGFLGTGIGPSFGDILDAGDEHVVNPLLSKIPGVGDDLVDVNNKLNEATDEGIAFFIGDSYDAMINSDSPLAAAINTGFFALDVFSPGRGTAARGAVRRIFREGAEESGERVLREGTEETVIKQGTGNPLIETGSNEFIDPDRIIASYKPSELRGHPVINRQKLDEHVQGTNANLRRVDQNGNSFSTFAGDADFALEIHREAVQRALDNGADIRDGTIIQFGRIIAYRADGAPQNRVKFHITEDGIFHVAPQGVAK